MHCLCFGAIGDRITNLLWRLNNNILEGLDPKVIWHFIGILIYSCLFCIWFWKNFCFNLSPKYRDCWELQVIVVSIGNSDYNLNKNEMLEGLKCVAGTVKSQKPNARLYFLVRFFILWILKYTSDVRLNFEIYVRCSDNIWTF